MFAMLPVSTIPYGPPLSHSTTTQILPDAPRPDLLPATLAALRASGYPEQRTVKEEMRGNLVRMLRDGAEIGDLFPGILGYETSVLPGLVNAILSRHDFILLGLRGQAKTRILRSLVRFLDARIPAIGGTDLNENPFRPITAQGRAILAEHGGDTPIRWIEPEERYQEKLATPDVTIADLIGDVDPIKAATQRLSYADQGVIHYGIVPRTNRGIFAINEVPDLPPRIQVGLLNILEEKDFQIRGFPLRIPLDICMVFSANPEDYTNRGNIISPLKDRIDSQIITHYPPTWSTPWRSPARRRGRARPRARIVIPEYFRELIEDVAFEARESEFVDQKSGVSARMTIALLENVISNVERRCLRHGDQAPPVRGCPTCTWRCPPSPASWSWSTRASRRGRRWWRARSSARRCGAPSAATSPSRTSRCATARRARKAGEEEADGSSPYAPIVQWFSQGNTVETADDLTYAEYAQRLAQVTGCATWPSRG